MGTLLRLPAPVCGQIGRRAGAKKSPPARPEHEVAAPTYRNDVPLRLVKQLHGDPDALRDRHGSSPGVTLAPSFLGCGVAAVRSRLPAPLAGLAKALEATFLNELFRRSGCFHGRLIAHLGHEQRGERKKRSRSRRAKGKPDGTGRVSSWAEAEGRPDETRDRGKRRRARTWETRGASLARTKDSSTRRVRGGVASGAGGGDGTRGLAARTLAGAGREPGRLLRKQQKMARLPQRA